jgi:hypothetical protein
LQERWVGAPTSVADLEAKIGIAGREIGQLRTSIDSLATSGLPFYIIPDVQTGDYVAEDSLTRGARFRLGLIQSAEATIDPTYRCGSAPPVPS